jgi:transcriptional regulator with XRE-family HTH domain
MQPATQKQKINLSHAKALKRSRELMKVTRIEMASRLNLSLEAIKKYESGRAIINEAKIEKWLSALALTNEDYQKIKRGKGISRNRNKKKAVLCNSDRRSYQRIITKECKVLRSMRRLKNISQDTASSLCGYSRPTIGHIENGRIELSRERIRYIVDSYGYEFSDFEANLSKEEQRDTIVDSCLEKISNLDDSKLEIVKNLLGSF